MSKITNLNHKDTLESILKEGVDKYVKRMCKVYKKPNFMRRLNRVLIDHLLHNVPRDILEDFKQMSSGHENSAYHPRHMLADMMKMRGNYLNETAYYTAVGYIFNRLQEHKSAYKVLKLALVAKNLSIHDPRNIEDLYRMARENKHIGYMIVSAEQNAYVTVARYCLETRNYFCRNPLNDDI